MVKNENDLRTAYMTLKFLKETGFEQAEPVQSYIKVLKKDIRDYFKRKEQEPQGRIVKSYGIDGFIELIPLPEFLESIEEAKAYFEANKVMVCRHSAYDCTGQLFTCWYKIIERQGKHFAYHRVACDV